MVFPGKDFLAGCWSPLGKTAAPFPDELPDCGALGFDAVKTAVCQYRGYLLCSVDAVTVTADGRILFIEFKDAVVDPIAQLRKKAFDSLMLFWIAVGQKMSMEEVRDRAVFCYVVPNQEPEVYSDELAKMFQEEAGEHPAKPLPDQIDDLRLCGLYANVKAMTTRDFIGFLNSEGVATTLSELVVRIGAKCSASLRQYRTPAPVCSIDFKTHVLPISELRMSMPYDQIVQDRNPLLLADSYDSTCEKVTFGHSWQQPFAVMRLATKCFDTFLMWSTACHPEQSLDALSGVLTGEVILAGNAPVLTRPSHTSKFVLDFYDAYCKHFDESYGLKVFEDLKLYQKVLTAEEKEGSE